MMFSASSAPHMGRTPDSSRASLYTGVLALLVSLLILPLPSVAQTTQTLSLDEGWNVVSLHVQSADSSFASIFGGTDGEISSVKNEDGEAYLPSLGIEQISTWRSDEGYKVHAETATTVDVTGTALAPGAVAIALEEGGNIVPYLPDRALAVEEALMSIDESLVAVEGEEGRQYPSGSTPLDSLRPGQGYTVYVDRADTLRYPAVVKTLDDALAMTGLDVGSHVHVGGRDDPGDKGGGRFRVTGNACRTDGGTCFGFDEDLSSEQEIVETGDLWGGDLPHRDLAWRSVEIQWGPSSGDVWTIWDLHGHIAKLPHRELVDTKRGLIKEGNYPGYRSDFVSGEPDWHIRYRYLTSDRRLQRLEVENNTNPDRLSVAWWGTTPVSEGWSGLADDNTNEINWALSTARRWQESGSLDTVYVDIPDLYWKLYQSLMPHNVLIRGTSDSSTRWPDGTLTRGGFKMPPGEALWHMDDREDPRPILQGKAWRFTHGYLPEWIGMKNIVIDGNLSGNQEPFDNPTPYGGAGAVANGLQNISYWTQWRTSQGGVEQASNATNNWQYIKGMDLFLRDVAIVSSGGNGINASAGSIEGNWDQVFFDTALRNHMIYGIAGNPQNVTTEGSEGGAWIALNKLGVWEDSRADGDIDSNKELAHPRNGKSGRWSSTFNNLTVQNVKENPEYTWSSVFNIERGHVTLDGFTVDLSDTKNNFGNAALVIFDNNGFPGSIMKGGTIYTPKNSPSSKPAQLLTRFGTKYPYTFQEYEMSKLENITIYDQHSEGFRIGNPNQKNTSTNVIYKDVEVIGAGGGGVPAAAIGSFDRINRIPGAKRIVYENATLNPSSGPIASFGGYGTNLSNTFPQDIFIKDSDLNNTGGKSIYVRKPSEDDYFGIDDRVYISNTTFNVPKSGLTNGDTFHYAFTDGRRDNLRTPGGNTLVVEGGATIRVRNCQTHSGLVSDSENNTFTSGASDEGNDFVLIPTSLLSRAREVSLTLTSSPAGISSITGWEVANSDGTLRPDDAKYEHEPYLKVSLDGTIESGETVTIDWTARVTPLDEYSPTGVFISRPRLHESTTLTSGNGPWILDLRGLAASQETWTPPAYSASSSDTGVVTANVTATNHRGTDRFWTLELTEQGTGTTTITVDAEIAGVGTATTTFEVTVE